MDYHPEGVTRRCSVKKVFLEISQNSQENICTRVSFLRSQACNFIKTESLKQVFSFEFCKHLSKNTFFRDIFGSCFCKSLQLYQNKTLPRGVFCELSKNFRNVLLMRCKNFLTFIKILPKTCLLNISLQMTVS